MTATALTKRVMAKGGGGPAANIIRSTLPFLAVAGAGASNVVRVCRNVNVSQAVSETASFVLLFKALTLSKLDMLVTFFVCVFSCISLLCIETRGAWHEGVSSPKFTIIQIVIVN